MLDMTTLIPYTGRVYAPADTWPFATVIPITFYTTRIKISAGVNMDRNVKNVWVIVKCLLDPISCY